MIWLNARALILSIVFIMLPACHEKAPLAEVPAAVTRPTANATVRNGRVLVSRSLVTSLGGTPGVYVITNGVARFRMVRTGKPDRDRVEVLSGLTGTERLVAGDLNGLHDGTPVMPTP